MAISIPNQVQQFYMQMPTQYRLVYLLMFLYTHQQDKVIIFASNCEVVNLLHKIFKLLDWNYCVNKRGQTGYHCSEPASYLFQGSVFKLHGNMEHSERKQTYLNFDKNPACALICTDVASRGLDFKGVSWVVHFDLSSQVKEYVNRVGRTARMANSGQSICFVMSPVEDQYVTHMKKAYGIEMHNKSRFTLSKLFEQTAKKLRVNPSSVESMSLVEFRQLNQIEDLDER